MSEKKIIPFGLIGAGNSGKNIAASLMALENAKLITIAAKTIEEAKIIGEKYQITDLTDNYKHLLQRNDIQAVVISVPHNLHYQMVMDALEAGKHVLCEKPLAINTTQGKDMIQKAKEKKLTLGTFFQNRFLDASQKAKSLLQENAIGKLLHAQVNVFWTRNQEYYNSSPWRGKWATEGGGSLINQSCHYIDLMIWLVGKPKTVFGVYGAKTHDIEVDDNAVATVVFENGVYATIQTSTSIDPGFPGLVNFYGTDGMISIDGNILKWVKKDKTQELLDFDKDKVGSANDPTLFAPVPHQRLINNFIEALLNNQEPIVDGYEGMRAIEVIEAIYQSKGEKIIHF